MLSSRLTQQKSGNTEWRFGGRQGLQPECPLALVLMRAKTNQKVYFKRFFEKIALLVQLMVYLHRTLEGQEFTSVFNSSLFCMDFL